MQILCRFWTFILKTNQRMLWSQQCFRHNIFLWSSLFMTDINFLVFKQILCLIFLNIFILQILFSLTIYCSFHGYLFIIQLLKQIIILNYCELFSNGIHCNSIYFLLHLFRKTKLDSWESIQF